MAMHLLSISLSQAEHAISCCCLGRKQPDHDPTGSKTDHTMRPSEVIMVSSCSVL